MTSFFELSDSKKKNLSLSELHNYAERLEVNINKISEKTGKEIKKKKNEIIEELNEKQFLHKVDKIKKDVKKSKTKNNEKCCLTVLLWLDNEKDKFNDDEYRSKMFSIKYLEETYKIKCKFGSIIYYGDYYIINKDKEFILLNIIDNENEEETNYLIIPSDFTKNIIDPIETFKKFKDNRIHIGKIELMKSHSYVKDKLKLEENDNINGINFYYTKSFKTNNFYFEIQLNYLGPKGIFNNNYPKFSFIPKDELSLIQLIDFHNKLSNHQFLFNFTLYGPSEMDIEPKWSESLFIKDLNKKIGNKKTKEDSIYNCVIYTNMYNRFKNKEIIMKQYETNFNSENENDSMMIKNKDFLTFMDKDDFNNFINEYKDIMSEI